MAKKIEKITRPSEKKARSAAKPKKIEKIARPSEKKPLLARLKRLARLKAFGALSKIGSDGDFVPFSVGVLSGGAISLFAGLVLGHFTAGPSCQGKAKLEVAKVFCENLTQKTVSDRCEGVDKKDQSECEEFIRAQVTPACNSLVEMEVLEEQAKETCK